MDASIPFRVKRTNFHGGWDDICSHCGRPQAEHRHAYGPHEGMLYEHRMPCAAERKKIHRKHRNMVWTARIIVLVIWVLVPLACLVLTQWISVLGWIAFAIGIFQLGIKTVEYFGDPDRWIPGHKEKKALELRNAHFVYHCDRNPEGFARLRDENFERWEKDGDEKGA